MVRKLYSEKKRWTYQCYQQAAAATAQRLSGHAEKCAREAMTGLLEIHELADRLCLPLEEITSVINERKLRYFLFSFGRVRFYWNFVWRDIQPFLRTGSPQLDVEAEMRSYQDRFGAAEPEQSKPEAATD
jgi:hypothetical protein